jgi:small subunit ribosomal protein S2
MTTKTTENTLSKDIQDMFNAGAHFGFSKARRHPSFKPFIFGTKNGTEIINLEMTEEYLKKALEFVAKLASQNKAILFVGSKSEVRDVVRSFALTIDMPYVADRWIGGTLTNFEQMKKRVARLDDLQSQKEKGELTRYTKKERLLLDREIDKLIRFFEGVRGMSKLPDALFVIDAKKEHIAVSEAQKMHIPIISLSSTDSDLSKIDFPIPANDSARTSVDYFVKAIAETYKKESAAVKKA